MTTRRMAAGVAALAMASGIAAACGFDDALREYLSLQFWLPFSRTARSFSGAERSELAAPYAGMQKASGDTALAQLRAAYQEIAFPDAPAYDYERMRRILAAARATSGLSAKERDEIDLLDAKIDLRGGSPAYPDLLHRARGKLRAFLRTARSPEYLSEARGWLACIHYLLGEQTEAGKIYLDELRLERSILTRETLVNSLRLTYGYDGGPRLLEQLDQYFDTAEHAAFAITLATNPRWQRHFSVVPSDFEPEPVVEASPPYERIKDLLLKHAHLFRSERGAEVLAVLGMRTALRAGDPAAALKIARTVPARAAVRLEPDFLWMLGSARFLARDYASAEAPLLRLMRSPSASDSERAAAAYGLCGVYRKTGNFVEQIRMALWLKARVDATNFYLGTASAVEDQTVYWAASGWDLGWLLDAEAPAEALRAFADKYPSAPEVRLVRYALAIRLARAEQYDESSRIYAAIGAPRRAARMQRLADLHRRGKANDAPADRLEAQYEMAKLLAEHSTGVYFNDTLWSGLQRYATFGERDARLTRAERTRVLQTERRLKDEQEELWRAYLILRDVVREAGASQQGRRAALLARQCVRRISERFGRFDEIAAADVELSRWLRRHSRDRIEAQ